MEKDISYYRIINNSLSRTVQQAEITAMKNSFKYDFNSNVSCKEVLLNGESTKVIYYVDTNNVIGGKSYKVMMKPDELLKVGDILSFDDCTWFVTEIMTNKMLTLTGVLAKSVHTLRFCKDGEIRELPCAVTVGTKNYINSSDNDYLRYSSSKFTVYCPDLGYLSRIEDIGRRFVINGLCYNIESLENLTQKDTDGGLIVIELNDDKIEPDDNFELGIANYYSQIQSNNQESNNESNDIIKIMPSVTTICLGESLNLTCSTNNSTLGNINVTLLNLDGSKCTYASITSNGNNQYTIYTSTDGRYVGKQFILKAVLKEDEEIKSERIFTIKSLI